MPTIVTTFGGRTASDAYMTCEVGGAWFFCPTDREWLSGNGNNEFSAAYPTQAAALAAAERWESENEG